MARQSSTSFFDINVTTEVCLERNKRSRGSGSDTTFPKKTNFRQVEIRILLKLVYFLELCSDTRIYSSYNFSFVNEILLNGLDFILFFLRPNIG